MNKLIELQTQLQKNILNNHNDGDLIVDSLKFCAQKRLEIYSQAYFSRLTTALTRNYPIFQAYVGEEKFRALSLEYIQSYPSSFRSIRWFGHEFVIFLQKKNLAEYLIELAELEWVMTKVFDAADNDVVAIETMLAIPLAAWTEMRFQMHSSVQCLNFKWNVMDIWQAMSENKDIPEPAQTPTMWLLWRKDFNHHCQILAVDEAWMMDQMLAGKTFADICEGLCKWIAEEEVAMRAAALLKNWLAAGLITAVILR